MYFIKEPGVHREEMAVSSAPVSHCELLGTILKNIGVESDFATIYDFADGQERERTVMRNYIDPAYPAVPKYHSTAVGTHTVMYAYTYTGDRFDLRKQFANDAAKRVKTNLVLEAIVKDANLEATDEDIDAEIKDLAAQYGMEEDAVSVMSASGIVPL